MSKRALSKASDDLVISKIHTVRGHRVMLDSELADLYEVESPVC